LKKVGSICINPQTNLTTFLSVNKNRNLIRNYFDLSVEEIGLMLKYSSFGNKISNNIYTLADQTLNLQE